MGDRDLPRRRWLPPVLLLLLLGCEPSATPLLGPSSAHLQQAVARPFRFTLTGNADPDFSQGPCNVVNTESGTGVAQHLGRVTWASEEVVNFCVDPQDPSRAEVTGALVITAANGDQLRGTYLSIVDADFGAGTLTAQGEFVITGGTGRFSGASGSGSISVAGSLLPPFEVEGTFIGELVY